MSDPENLPRIPQCDPRASYLAARNEIDAAIADVMANGRYILGPEVSRFEGAFATWLGAGQATGVANGTDALELALRAVGVEAGDVVITTAHTAVATTVAIRAAGAFPVFADVDDADGLIAAADVRSLLEASASGRLALGNGKVRAVVPVHLYGKCAEIPRLALLCEEFGAVLVEDCAQSHGAALSGRRSGRLARIAAFSFYPTKNLGAFGDGGAVVTMDPGLHERVRLLREYGWRDRYVSAVEGGNSRLDELQAAMLSVKLARLDAGNSARRRIAARYSAEIDNPRVRLPSALKDQEHVFHQYAIRADQRDALRAWLHDAGIGTLVHYPCPIHRQPAYANPAYAPLPLPRTEAWAASVLSLPMFPELDDASVDRVISAVNAWRPG